MALEKSTFARRKAQKLARDGEIAPAIEEMRRLVGEPETDPYDHVYLGDLLMREGRPQEALDAWMRAVQSYESAGLNRNAIAVGKKVLRLDHGRIAVHRTLGDLYCREGLLGEAMPHFLQWLDTVNGDARFTEEFLSTLDRAASAVGLQVEAALRLADHYVRVRHHGRAARMLHGLADKVQTSGSPEMASELRGRAQAAERALAEQAAGGEAAAAVLSAAIAPSGAPVGPDEAAGFAGGRPAPPNSLTGDYSGSVYTEDAGGSAGDPFPDVTAAVVSEAQSPEDRAEPVPEPLPEVSPEVLPELTFDCPPEMLAEGLPEPAFDCSPEIPPGPAFDCPPEIPPEPTFDCPPEIPPEPTFDCPPETSPEPAAERSPDVRPETTSTPSAFFVEHFPIGSGGAEFGAEAVVGAPEGVSWDRDRAEAEALGETGVHPSRVDPFPHPAPPWSPPAPEELRSDLISGGGEDAEDVLEDGEDKIWDLDAEDEALRSEPEVEEPQAERAERDEPGLASFRQVPFGPAGTPPEPFAPPARVLPDSTWSETADSMSRIAPGDPDEIAWPSGVTLRSLVERAEAAYGSGRWAEARGLYDRAAHEEPLEPTVLTRLVEIARKLDDPTAEVHYLEQLGDAWIQAGVMEEALEAFLEVLRIDPESNTARRRLSRFQEMGVPGAERIPEATRESVQGVLEAAGARLSVRDDPGSAIQGDEWIDLGALINEFRTGVKNQIAEDDAPGHYDLAVSHHGMGLLDEAVEELDLVLACPDLAVEMELHTRELRGKCLLALQRHREAVHEFRSALERPVPDTESRCSLLYHLGMALESAEEWREATEIFERVQDELPGFLDSDARRRACEMRARGIDPEACAA